MTCFRMVAVLGVLTLLPPVSGLGGQQPADLCVKSWSARDTAVMEDPAPHRLYQVEGWLIGPRVKTRPQYATLYADEGLTSSGGGLAEITVCGAVDGSSISGLELEGPGRSGVTIIGVDHWLQDNVPRLGVTDRRVVVTGELFRVGGRYFITAQVIEVLWTLAGRESPSNAEEAVSEGQTAFQKAVALCAFSQLRGCGTEVSIPGDVAEHTLTEILGCATLSTNERRVGLEALYHALRRRADMRGQGLLDVIADLLLQEGEASVVGRILFCQILQLSGSSRLLLEERLDGLEGAGIWRALLIHERK